MPATFKITVDVSQLARLQPWAAKLKQGAITATQQAFKNALPSITSAERVRTGNMRNSTILRTESSGAQITASAGYSGFQNFGTRYMSGTHFMETGVSNITSALPALINSAIAI
jgi:HK97 gp10 family phage protein